MLDIPSFAQRRPSHQLLLGSHDEHSLRPGLKRIRSFASSYRALISAILLVSAFLFVVPQHGSISRITTTGLATATSALTGHDEDRRDVLILNVWLGDAVPDYLMPMLDSVRKNPSVSFLLVATNRSPNLCPAQGVPRTITEKDFPNVRIECMDEEDVHSRFANAMCKTWQCTTSEGEVTLAAVRKLLENPYRMNNLKPLYQAAMQDLWEVKFPSKRFSHWIRMDLDFYLGDFDAYFPHDRLDYDVLTFFPSFAFEPRQFAIRGYFAAFKVSDQMRDHWIRMPKFTSPAIFASPSVNLDAIDEGLQTKTLLMDPDVSIYSEPGRLYNDLHLQAHEKVVFSGNSANAVVVDASIPDHNLLLGMQAIEARSKRGSSFKATNMTFMRYVDMQTHDCDVLQWIPEEDRLCMAQDEDFDLSHTRHHIALIRPPGSTRLALYRTEESDEVGDRVDFRGVLGFHLIVSKAHSVDGFFANGRVLAKDEVLEIWFDAELDKYASRFRSMGSLGT